MKLKQCLVESSKTYRTPGDRNSDLQQFPAICPFLFSFTIFLEHPVKKLSETKRNTVGDFGSGSLEKEQKQYVARNGPSDLQIIGGAIFQRR